MIQLIIEGNLAADPKVNLTDQGVTYTWFRVLHTARKQVDGQWIDGATTAVDVTRPTASQDRLASSSSLEHTTPRRGKT